MKPDLPSVKESPWLKSYQPSGICSPKTSALMLGLGILSGAVTGFTGYYGGFLTSGLAQLGLVILGVIGGCGGCLGLIGAAIYGLIFIGALGLGYPGLLGFGLGYLIWLLAKKGKCRNSSLAAGIGFLCGVVAYAVFAWIAIRFDGLHETSYLTRLLPSLSSTSGWMILIVVVDALILVGATAATPWSYIQDIPFCEECDEWYGKPVKAFYPANLAQPLIQAIESGILQDIEKYPRLPSDAQGARLSLDLQRCSCDRADYKLSTMIHWQEVKTEKGKQKLEEKNEAWFTTMIPANLGRQLEAALFATPVPATALKPA